MATCGATHYNECERVMSNESIVATLHAHGVRAYYSESEGRVLAYEEATQRLADGSGWTDASAWIPAPTTIHALASWLGY